MDPKEPTILDPKFSILDRLLGCLGFHMEIEKLNSPQRRLILSDAIFGGTPSMPFFLGHPVYIKTRARVKKLL